MTVQNCIPRRSLLRLFTGVVLEVVVFDLIGVEVVFGRLPPGSESEFSKFWTIDVFLMAGAISFNIPSDYQQEYLRDQT